jgi:NADH-quinone oxidoreductase subunit N
MNAIIISAVWGLVMMYSGIMVKPATSVRNLAVFGLVLLLAANVLQLSGVHLFPINTRGMLNFDRYSLLFTSITTFATLVYFLLSGREIEEVGVYKAEYFALIFFILCGVSVVTAFTTLLMLFLGIEIISIPLYILTGSDKRNLKSNEASLKYFLMGSFSTGIMLMGIALIYGARATFFTNTNVTLIPGFDKLLVAGLLLLFISMAFKVSAAPFHFWTPDVYDGAPTVFTSFMATIVKVGVFAGFIRLFDGLYTTQPVDKWKLTLAVIITLTLFIGNITAVFQQSVKRMLAYSSIAQAGFMMFALFSFNDLAKEGMILYAAAYSFATIGIFAILAKMKDYTFEGFNGLSKTQPVLAAANSIFLLSLAGIPLTAGFFAKYYMLASAIKTGTYLWLVIFAVIMAAISVYYYFRVIQAMYFKTGNADVNIVTPSFKYIIIVLAALIILLGVFPQLLLLKLYF